MGIGALALVAASWAVAAATALGAESAYVSNLNGGGQDISQYDIGAGGLLSPKSPQAVSSAAGPFGSALTPDGRHFYVANANDNKVSQYDVGPGGTLAAKTPANVAGGTTPVAVAVSPDGKSLYVANQSSNDVSQYDIGADGTLSPKAAAVAAGTNPRAIAVTPDGKSVYVANYASSNVSQYSVGAGGTLTPKTPTAVTAGQHPSGIAVTPDGGSVYVANGETASGGTVSQYDVGADGALSAKPAGPIAAGPEPRGVAVSPDGRSVYVANINGGTVSQYDVGPGGGLSPKAPATIGAGTSPIALTVNPDGRSVYVANNLSNDVSEYDAAANGALSAKTPATIAASTNPIWISLAPDQGPVAAFAPVPTLAGSASSFDASASSDPDGTVARYDWDFGDGTTSPNGGPTPTHTYAAPGDYTVRLTVTDEAGCSMAFVFTGQTASCNGGPAATTTRTVTVAASPSPPGVSPPTQAPTPVLSALTLTPNAFYAAPSGPSIAKKRFGTTVSYRVAQPGTTTFRVQRATRGVRKGKLCVKAPRHTKRHIKHCTRYATLPGSFSHRDVVGRNSFRFTGRLNGRKLKIGRYLLVATQRSDAGVTGRPAIAGFRVKG